jgi:hypothetical protein
MNECRALIDTMLAAAAKAKPPLPAVAKALLEIKPIEGSDPQRRVGLRLEGNERA